MQQNTALKFLDAVRRGKLSIVKETIASGIDVNMTDDQSRTPIFLAADRGNTDMIRELVKAGADINKPNNMGETPLFIAADNAYPDTLKTLIELGANVNIVRNDGASPLYVAAKFGDRATVIPLLKAGADLNANGILEMARAGEFVHPDISRLIIRYASRAGEIVYPAIRQPNVRYASQPSTNLSTANNPANAPLQCFDPIMVEDKDISTDGNAVFFIQDLSGKTISAGCLDEATLDVYKKESTYVFYRCRETTPISALMITSESVFPEKYRLLNFAMRIYVRDIEAQRLKTGTKYILRPVELLGRIASQSVLSGGSVVSALHCGPADNSLLYSIHKVIEGGGRRRRTMRRKRRSHRRQH